MRVVLLPSAYAPAVGGVEELTHRLALELTACGHEVEVWTNRHPAGLSTSERIHGIQVRRFVLPLPAANAASVAAFLATAGPSLRALRRAVRRFRPAVLHVQCFSTNGAWAAALARTSRIPLLVTLQGETVMDDHDIYERSLSMRFGLRFGLSQAGVVTGCSQFVLDDARRFGLHSDRGLVIPNGVAEVPDQAVALSLPHARFVFAVGRMVRKKGFDLLLDAFRRIADAHPGVGLVIGGDGPARPELEHAVADAGLGERVLLPGPLSRGQVVWAMQNAEVFVMPSRVEPFGIVALEALSAGCPTIVSRHGGAAEFIRDGIDGLVVDPFDPEALATGIDELLEDGPRRARLADAGRERSQEFRWGAVTQRYVDLYETLVSQR